MKNRGFSIIQIIVAITVTGVFSGVLCPFGVRFAEQTRRMKDVYAASEIAYQFQLMMSSYGGFAEEMLADDMSDTCIVDWQKEELIHASGMTEEQIVETGIELNESGQYSLDKVLFYHLDKIPESVADSDYAWSLHYDANSGTVENIYLVEKNESGSVIAEMEIYPSYAAFVDMK